MRIIKKLSIAILAIALVVLITGCMEPIPNPTPSPTPIISPTPEPTIKPTTRPTIAPPTPTPTIIPAPLPDIWKVQLIFVDGQIVWQNAGDRWAAENYVNKIDKDDQRAFTWIIYNNNAIYKSGFCSGSVLITPTPTPVPTSSPKPTQTPDYSPIPSDYYNQNCSIPPNINVIDYLTKYHWSTPYQAGSWDCSKMSTYLEWQLENCGYDVVIQTGVNHAWILIYLPANIVIRKDNSFTWETPKAGYYIFESTGRFFPVGGELNEYKTELQFNDIHNCWNYFSQYSNGKEVFLKEYGWWI